MLSTVLGTEEALAGEAGSMGPWFPNSPAATFVG